MVNRNLLLTLGQQTTTGKLGGTSAPLPGCLYPEPEFSVPLESKIISTASTSCFR